MKILIVGAGPAGLAAASFLDTKKHQITVIEKQKQFSTMGFGVFFFNEGKKLLRKATHDAILPKLLTQIGFKQYIDKQGDVLGDTHYNQLFHVNSYDAVTSIKREDLHGLLRTHLPKEVTVKMGTTIRQIDNFEDHAVVKLSDRTEERYDLVIGADGVHSQLRELFFSYKIKKLNWVARYFWLDKSIPRFLMEWSRDAT
ncbi:MAG: FAD-dependent monooxygenase, partial [Thermodesulfobacteriota bacterium]